jgi:hypothetical protein
MGSTTLSACAPLASSNGKPISAASTSAAEDPFKSVNFDSYAAGMKEMLSHADRTQCTDYLNKHNGVNLISKGTWIVDETTMRRAREKYVIAELFATSNSSNDLTNIFCEFTYSNTNTLVFNRGYLPSDAPTPVYTIINGQPAAAQPAMTKFKNEKVELSKNEYLILAQHIIGDNRLTKSCVDDFKENMNDPSSFQIAGTWGTTKLSYAVSKPDEIVVVLPIRGKNGYGGLVRSNVGCYYAYDRSAETFAFKFAISL